MNKLVLLCIFGFAMLLTAQVSPYAEFIQNARTQLAANPADISKRLSLAYYLMLNGEASSALVNYETVLLQDSLNADAAAGVLWAHNSLGEWQKTIRTSAGFIDQLPEYAPLYSFKAYALAQEGYQVKALQNYKRVLRHNPAPDLVSSAASGMGWAYLALGDYPAAQRSFQKAAAWGSKDQAAAAALAKGHLRFDLSGAANYDSTLVYGIKLSYRLRGLKTSLAVEDLLVAGKHFRYRYQGELACQFAPAEISLKAASLDGDDSRAYPGRLGSIGVQTKLYLGSMVIDPKVVQYVGLYERFNLYQTDLNLSALLHPFYTSYGYSYLYQDSDSAGSDTRGEVHSLQLGYQFPKDLHLALYASTGDLAWWTSPHGIPLDDFEPVDSYYGISLFTPLIRHLGILLYHQIGYAGNELRQLSSINVSYNI